MRVEVITALSSAHSSSADDFWNRLPLPCQVADRSRVELAEQLLLSISAPHLAQHLDSNSARPPDYQSFRAHTHTVTESITGGHNYPEWKRKTSIVIGGLERSSAEDNLQPAQFQSAQVNGHNGADISSSIWEHQYFPSTETVVNWSLPTPEHPSIHPSIYQSGSSPLAVNCSLTQLRCN